MPWRGKSTSALPRRRRWGGGKRLAAAGLREDLLAAGKVVRRLVWGVCRCYLPRELPSLARLGWARWPVDIRSHPDLWRTVCYPSFFSRRCLGHGKTFGLPCCAEFFIPLLFASRNLRPLRCC